MELITLWLLMVVTVPVVFSERKDYNYCKIPSCLRGTHVFCKFKTTEISKACGEVSKSRLDGDEKKMILELHNEFRDRVHKGQETRGLKGGQPSAAKPSKLEWDNELEDIAHRWSIQCIDDKAACADTEKLLTTQLITNRITRNSSEVLSIKSILWDWYNEVESFDRNFILKYSEHKSFLWDNYHYTQIVWGKTKKVGCNSIRHSYGRYRRLKFICIYGPGGNNEGLPVYQISETEYESQIFQLSGQLS